MARVRQYFSLVIFHFPFFIDTENCDSDMENGKSKITNGKYY